MLTWFVLILIEHMRPQETPWPHGKDEGNRRDKIMGLWPFSKHEEPQEDPVVFGPMSDNVEELVDFMADQRKAMGLPYWTLADLETPEAQAEFARWMREGNS